MSNFLKHFLAQLFEKLSFLVQLELFWCSVIFVGVKKNKPDIYCKNIGSCRCYVGLAKIMLKVCFWARNWYKFATFRSLLMCLFVLKKSVESLSTNARVNFKSSHHLKIFAIIEEYGYTYSTLYTTHCCVDSDSWGDHAGMCLQY